MLRFTIKHNQFQLTLSAYALSAQAYLVDFVEHLPPQVVIANTPPTDWRLSLVTAEPVLLTPSLDALDDPKRKMWARLHRAWAGLETTWCGTSLLTLEEGTPDCHSIDFVHLIPRDRKPPEARGLLSNYVFYIEKRWLIQQGGLLIHASAVVRKKRGFMFLGKSGAGKTTTTQLSRGIADAIIHDDKIFVMHHDDRYFLRVVPSANTSILAPPEDKHAARSGLQGCGAGFNSGDEVSLCAAFVLKKDKDDYLMPLSGLAAAHALVEGFLEASDGSGIVSPPQDLKHAMQALSSLARRIPAFELHFRKSPDFWKLIDEQFPD
jgi:hypothetical protein